MNYVINTCRTLSTALVLVLSFYTQQVWSFTEGLQTITYQSSVDSEEIGAYLWIPQGVNIEDEDVPLVIYLHGGGDDGSGMVDFKNGVITDQLDAKGWIGLAISGRKWGLHDIGCSWEESAAYVNNPDPNVGPGQQDILDGIDWAEANFSIDANRIYMTGFSMGGRGTYIIGLKNPHRFAAIAPMSPAADMYEVYTKGKNMSPGSSVRICNDGLTGGIPGDSLFVDTMHTITSGRFLIENAYNLPVMHSHGYLDDAADNIPGIEGYLHGYNMTIDSSWDGCHDDEPSFCFGHTPTLSELQSLHPQGYDWAYMFTAVPHRKDTKWITGTPISDEDQGVEDSLNPGQLIGIFDFLEQHTLNSNPKTVVYKSYTDTDRKAYWLEIDITTPWLDIPGAIRANRFSRSNRLNLELVRIENVTIDLQSAGLEINSGRSLKVDMQPLLEPTYDPALVADGETLTPTLTLKGDFVGIRNIRVLRDGITLPPSTVQLSDSELIIGPFEDINQATSLTIRAR